MNGGMIHPPNINKSQYQTFIEGRHIYLGFILLHSFTVKNAERIVKERERNGLFLDLDDFIERIPIALEQITILIKVSAFQFTKRNKRELLWEAYMKVNKVCLEEEVMTLFKTEKVAYKTPELTSSSLEDAFDEIQYIGFPLCSPFDLLAQAIPQGLLSVDLPGYIGKTVTVYGYYVTAKRTVTSKGDRMYFGNFVDIKGDHLDTVHFPPAVKKNPFRGKGVYQLTGKVMEEFDCITIEIEKMEKLAIIQDPRYAEENKKVIV
jgi:DNA polymerase-3 subunit alpha